MTERDMSAQTSFDAGFDFARRLRDPAFRAFLKSCGWTSGQHVIMAADSEPVLDVIARLITHQTDGRAFIAIPNERERYGFRLLIAEPAPLKKRWGRSARRVERIKISREATIGMLYEALHPCEYIPTEWNRPLVFERVLAPA